MTDEQINTAIAEACGWKNLHSHALNPTVWVGDEPLDDGRYLPFTQVPDFCNCLNAMHEAEKVLIAVQHIAFDRWLQKAVDKTNTWSWHATARQRAEAFLRALGKWEEVQS